MSVISEVGRENHIYFRTRRAFDRFLWWMAIFAGIILSICAFYITSDVISRKWFKWSSETTDEIGGYILALVAGWSLAVALNTKAHIRIDVIIAHLPPRLQGYMNYIAYVTLLGVLIIFLWRGWLWILVQHDLRTRANTITQAPLYIPMSIWMFGITMFGLLTFILVLEATYELFRGRARGLAGSLGSLTLEAQLEEALVDETAKAEALRTAAIRSAAEEESTPQEITGAIDPSPIEPREEGT